MTTWLQARHHHPRSSIAIGNDWKVGSSKSQLTSLSLALGTNVRGLHSLVYAWKEKLLTGRKLTRINTHLEPKYRLGSRYTMVTITAQIVHTCRFTNWGRLAPSRITLTKLIDWTPTPTYRIVQWSILVFTNSQVPSAAVWYTMNTYEKTLTNGESNSFAWTSLPQNSDEGPSTAARMTTRIGARSICLRIGYS